MTFCIFRANPAAEGDGTALYSCAGRAAPSPNPLPLSPCSPGRCRPSHPSQPTPRLHGRHEQRGSALRVTIVRFAFCSQASEIRAGVRGSHDPKDRQRDRRACGPLTLRLTSFVFYIRPTSLPRKVKRQAPRFARRLRRGRVLALRAAGRTTPVCDPLTVRFRAVGRASPSPTLFRRIHAYSVGQIGRGAAHRRNAGTRSATASPQKEANTCRHLSNTQRPMAGHSQL